MTKICTGLRTTRQPLWYGLERGASLAGLAATTSINGHGGSPFHRRQLARDVASAEPVLGLAHADIRAVRPAFQQSVGASSRTSWPRTT
jgi:hypothetical protein